MLFPTLLRNTSSTVGSQGSLERERPTALVEVLNAAFVNGLGLQDLEDGMIEEAVLRSGGNLAAASRVLGLTRPQLAYRLQRLQADSSQP